MTSPWPLILSQLALHYHYSARTLVAAYVGDIVTSMLYGQLVSTGFNVALVVQTLEV